MSTTRALTTVSVIAAAQGGLFTTSQAEGQGVKRWELTRLVKAGALERIAYRVYRLAASRPGRNDDLIAAWMQLAPETPNKDRVPAQGVVSHMSAIGLYGALVISMSGPEASMTKIDFTFPPGERRIRLARPDAVVHRAQLELPDVYRFRVAQTNGVLATSGERTFVDLLATGTELSLLLKLFPRIVRGWSTRALASQLAPFAQAYGFNGGDEFARTFAEWRR